MENKNYLIQLVKQIVHPYFASEIADMLIAHGVTVKSSLTNGDNIRSMDDEELAQWILNGVSDDPCDYCQYNNGYCDGSPCRGKADADTIIEWIRQPPEEE